MKAYRVETWRGVRVAGVGGRARRAVPKGPEVAGNKGRASGGLVGEIYDQRHETRGGCSVESRAGGRGRWLYYWRAPRQPEPHCHKCPYCRQTPDELKHGETSPLFG